MTRPKAARDQAALDQARAHLAELGAGQSVPAENITALTPDERARRLTRRAQARTIATRDQPGGDAA